MYKIEVIGMRKKRKKAIIISIVILAIIAILICLGMYLKHINNVAIEVSTTEINETKGLNSGLDTTNDNDDKSQTTNTEAQESTTEQNNNEGDNNTIPTEENNSNKFINLIDNIYNGTEGKRVFLTFDDGPTQEVTPRILDILKKYNVKATFFVLGNRVKANPEILKREYDEGHYIANHGYSHKYKNIYESENTVLNEYNKTEVAIREAIGNPNYSSNLFRFPGGSHGGPYENVKKKARKKLKENGIAYLDWSALTYDAEGADSKEEIIKNLENTMNGWDNVVILMHDAADKKITYETLEDVIKYLQKKGYKFENIYDLMEE